MSAVSESSFAPRAATTVTVPLGERAYDVIIGAGLLPDAARLIASRVGKARCVIVTDENVAARHLATLEAAAKGDKGTLIFLRADKAVPYGELMEVMNLLRKAGYLKVALVGLEKVSGP